MTGRDIDRQGVSGDHRAEALLKSAHGKDRLHNAASFWAVIAVAAAGSFLL